MPAQKPARPEPHGTLRGNWRGEYDAEALAEFAARDAAAGLQHVPGARYTAEEMIKLGIMPARRSRSYRKGDHNFVEEG